MPEEQEGRRIGRGLFLATVAGGVSSLFWGKAAWNAVSSTVSPAVGTFAPFLPTQGWRIYTVSGSMPGFDRATWRLDVGGLAQKHISLSYDELLALPKVAKVPCGNCEAKLDAAIRAGEGKSTLGDLNLETTMLRNYFAWAGGKTPSAPMPDVPGEAPPKAPADKPKPADAPAPAPAPAKPAAPARPAPAPKKRR